MDINFLFFSLHRAHTFQCLSEKLLLSSLKYGAFRDETSQSSVSNELSSEYFDSESSNCKSLSKASKSSFDLSTEVSFSALKGSLFSSAKLSLVSSYDSVSSSPEILNKFSPEFRAKMSFCLKLSSFTQREQLY